MSDQGATMPEPLEMTLAEAPLALTLEEAMRAVHWERLGELREAHGVLADVQMEITDTGWWVFLNDDGKLNRVEEFGTWQEAASFALGRPVVERDDKAALVKALRELVDAMHHYEGDVDGDAPPAHHRMMERARAALAAVGEES